MPKTAVDENYTSPAGQNQVRLPRQSTPVKAVAKSKSINEATNLQFRLRVLRSDTAHPFAALLR